MFLVVYKNKPFNFHSHFRSKLMEVSMLIDISDYCSSCAIYYLQFIECIYIAFW